LATNRTNRVQYHCSFCGKNQDQVRRLIAGPGAVYICDECVDLCREIIDEESGSATTAASGKTATGLSDRVPPPKSIYDHLQVSASLEGRMIAYVDHLHEHFVDPVVVDSGRYRVPERPGYSSEMRAESLARFAFPDGTEWAGAGREVGAGRRAAAAR